MSSKTFEVFSKTHSRIVQANSIENAMSKFKDLSDDKIIGIWDIEYNPHSPTEPVSAISAHTEFNTLQEGDWFQGTEEDYRSVLELQDKVIETLVNSGTNSAVNLGFISAYKSKYINRVILGFSEKKTQLTPEEFIRRAENTFKTK